MENIRNLTESSPVQMPVKKKISFIAAIFLVFGNSIGAGIFFKSSTVMGDSGLSLPIAVFSWIVAAVAIICLALALVEVSSGMNHNLAIIGWCKAFNGKYIYKGCKYFMTVLYLPLSFFFMPFYALLSVQDSIAFFGAKWIDVNGEWNVVLGRAHLGTDNDWAIWSAIALVINLWFIIVSGLSARVGNWQNKVIAFLKFIPLVFAALMGWITASVDGFQVNTVPIQHWTSARNHDLFVISPLFGFFGALAAIFFAYDGFYATAGIQTEMREPRKTPKAIVIGLLIVTLVYLLIAISMFVISTDASLFAFAKFLVKHRCGWIGGIINLLVALGVLGIVNGYSMWCTRYLQDLMRNGELPVPIGWFKRCQNDSFPVVGVVATLLLTIPTTIIFDVIGGLTDFPGTYKNEFGLVHSDGSGSNTTAKLYLLVDLIATWCAVFAFAFIACAVLGCIRNRRTNLTKVKKTKFFLPVAWIAVITVFASVASTVIEPIANIGLYIQTADEEKLISNVLLVVILMVFSLVSFGPVYFEERAVKLRLKKLELLWDAVQKGSITNHPNANTKASDEYIESLRGYIEATRAGVESFKVQSSFGN